MATEKDYSKLSIEELLLEEKKNITNLNYCKAVSIIAPILALCSHFFQTSSSTYIYGFVFSVVLAVITMTITAKELKIIQSEIRNKQDK